MYINNEYMFSQSAIEDAVEHCRSKLPEEAGGLFVDNEFIPFDNVYPDKEESYAIGNNTDYNKLYIDGKIDCVIHSHDNKQWASPQDLSFQENSELNCGIINFKNGGAQQFVFWGADIEPAPLIDRPFFFGVFDCMTLTRDYTYERTGIELYSPVRDMNYWKENRPVFEESVNSDVYPVKFIDKADVKNNDFVFYKMGGSKVINHVAVVNNKGRVLHHFLNKKSMTLPLSFYQEYAYCGGRLII